MNKTRRKQVKEIIDRLESIQDDIKRVQWEEEEKLENYDPVFMKTKQYEKSEESATFLNDAQLTIDEVLGFLHEAIEE